MDKDFVFTQTKEITMTSSKTITVITKTLEMVDEFGKRKLCGYTHSKKVDLHQDDFVSGRAA